MPAPAVAAPVVTEDPLLTQLDEAIRVNSQRYLVAGSNSPWQIFHGVLAYRRDFQVRVGDQKRSAIDWMANDQPTFRNKPLLLVTRHGGKFHPFTAAYEFEGHPGQSLALLSESHLPIDFAFKVGQKSFTIADVINNTMQEVNSGEEITWVLWGLINYLKVDAQWTNQWNQAWSIETLVSIQVRDQVETGPCGGNHGLFALVRARDKYLKSGRPLRGVWLEADQKIKRYLEIARSLQNSDGSFSSEFYRGPGYSQDMNVRFNTTGHTFEFVSVALPPERLGEPWVRNAAAMLARELIQHRRAQPDCGPLYHSLNSIINYRDRLRGRATGTVLTSNPVTGYTTSGATTPGALTVPATPPAGTPAPATASPATPAILAPSAPNNGASATGVTATPNPGSANTVPTNTGAANAAPVSTTPLNTPPAATAPAAPLASPTDAALSALPVLPQAPTTSPAPATPSPTAAPSTVTDTKPNPGPSGTQAPLRLTQPLEARPVSLPSVTPKSVVNPAPEATPSSSPTLSPQPMPAPSSQPAITPPTSAAPAVISGPSATPAAAPKTVAPMAPSEEDAPATGPAGPTANLRPVPLTNALHYRDGQRPTALPVEFERLARLVRSPGRLPDDEIAEVPVSALETINGPIAIPR